MKITDVRALPISFSIPSEFQVSLGIGRTIKRDAVLVRVETADGFVGWGESHAARAPTAIAELINTTLRSLIIGMVADDIGAVWNRIYDRQLASHGAGTASIIAMSGIDIALWDIKGKRAERPVYELLGGALRQVPAYAGGIALGYQPRDELRRELDRVLNSGYTALKLRLGDALDQDEERVVAARAHVGDAVAILTDANTAYDLPAVARMAPTLESNNVLWLEEPFPAHAYQDYIAAAKQLSVPLAAGENHYARFDFERVRDDGAITIWQPDVSKAGGLSEILRIASMAQDLDITIHPHTSVTRVNMAASLHLLCALS
ncbi:MAG: mandelate racemase/muconate lactonizing enzyme family protein, partial [Pseudomonadota bacterium]